MSFRRIVVALRGRHGAKVLFVLRALGVGDFLTAVPALRALGRAFPDFRRVLATPAYLRPLVELSRTVDVLVPAGPLEPVPLGSSPAVGVNLHGRGPQSHAILLATRPHRLLTFAHPDVAASWGHPRWRPDEHEVHRWCRLLGDEGVPADPSLVDLPSPLVAVEPTARGATIVHPGAADAARRWPVERFAAVARAERDAGRTVLVTGGPDEIALGNELAARAGLPRAAVVAGRTDLGRLAALIAAAGRVVCGDTGIAHLATAFRTPSVVLFGPVSPAHWGPPPSRPWHRALWAGRTGDPHGQEPDRGLLEIGVGDVLHALADLPAPPLPPAQLGHFPAIYKAK